MPREQNGAKLLVNSLIAHGVDTIFAIPGAKIDAVFDALFDVQDKIKLIICRHEQNAAFMAAIHGRLTGKPGVVLVTSGPGVSNLATGLLTATTEGDPVIALGANVPRSMLLKETHQSSNNVALMTPVTKSSVEVLLVENIPEVIENAFRIATKAQSGAAFISFPQDVLTDEITVKAIAPSPIEAHGHAPLAVIKQAVELIESADCAVVFLGLEASKENNTLAVRKLLEKTAFPVISTYQAAGVISRSLVKDFVGRVGLFKNQPGDQLLDEADVVITLGFSPVEYDPEIWNRTAKKKIIHIAPKPAEIHLSYQPKLELLDDLASNLQELSALLKPRAQITHSKLVITLQNELRATISSGRNMSGDLVHPLRFIHELEKVIDDDSVIISDVGTHYIWLARYLYAYQPHHLLFSNGQQTLGVALPWAVSTALLQPNKKIISVSGDGGFLFSAMELETAVREKCHFVHCVWCDGSYDMVAEQQMMKYQRSYGVQFGAVNLVDFAHSFSAKAYLVKHSDDLFDILKKALQDEGPVLIEIPIDYSDSYKLFTEVYEHLGH